MGRRQGRLARSCFVTGWLVATGLTLRAGVRAPETGPEHLISLLALSYLTAWGPFFLLSRQGPAGRLAGCLYGRQQ